MMINDNWITELRLKVSVMSKPKIVSRILELNKLENKNHRENLELYMIRDEVLIRLLLKK